MASKLTEVIFHVAMLIYYGYVDYEILTGVHGVHLKLGLPADDPDLLRWLKGTPIYFTFWNLILHQVYFGLCCLSHLANASPGLVPGSFIKNSNALRHGILKSIFVPSALLVMINYWILSSIRPEMVFSQFLQALPPWFDHSIHTLVAPIAITELYIRTSSGGLVEFGGSRGWKILSGYLTFYFLACVFYTVVTGDWPYPFVDHMTVKMRAAFVLYVYASAWVHHNGVAFVGKKIWGKPGVLKQAIPLKKKK